jgi:TolA-binding protein
MKSETRNPKSEGNPKSEIRTLAVAGIFFGTRVSRCFRISDFGFRIFCFALLLLFLCRPAAQAAPSVTNAPAITNAPAEREPEPVTARELFNAGTRNLSQGKLREAEALLQSSLARQEPKFQPPALYNLGHVRFGQGKEELKKSLSGSTAGAAGRGSTRRAARAIAQGNDALAGTELEKLVAAYRNGLGARRELLAATTAVSRALETHGAALRKWQRALGDFQGAAELNPADTNALHNAQCVEREIAKLVDSIRELQQMASAMGATQPELNEVLQQLRGRIPKQNMPPGADGEEEQEGEGGRSSAMPELTQGLQEGPAREGEEMLSLSPEAARWLLESFPLDSNRRLSMGGGEPALPRERNRRNW